MSVLRMMAVLFGIVFITFGILGFMPEYSPNGLLLGIFEVNDMHNYIHLLSGIVALVCSLREHTARWYFIIFGIVYGLVALLGVFMSGDLMVMHVNAADNVLHTAIALVSLWLGFFYRGVSDLR